MLNFDLPKNQSSIIKVIGVGGGGSNAVTHMYHQGIKGVDFIICNTDAQAMEASPVPTKIQLGATLTSGLGAGAVPSVGKNAALENKEDIRSILEKNTKMLFITAGLGGGTGTGAAPVIASVARELGILTVAIVTLPFSFEGRKRKQHAEEGIAELKRHVDALLIITNDKLRELYGNLTLRAAFSHADDVLTIAAKGIAELITVTGYINVDFEDVRTVMKDSGVAIMGVGIASGENRASLAIEQAMSSPLLNDDNVEGANNILLYIVSGKDEIKMDEVSEITEYIQAKTKSFTEVIWGNGIDESLEDKISVTVIATGFDDEHKNKTKPDIKPARIIHSLDGKSGVIVEEPKILPVEDTIPEKKFRPAAQTFIDPKPKQVEQPLIEPAPVVPEPLFYEPIVSATESIVFEQKPQRQEEMPMETEQEPLSSINFEIKTPEILFPEEEFTEEESFVKEPTMESLVNSQRMLVFEIADEEQKTLPEAPEFLDDNQTEEKISDEAELYQTYSPDYKPSIKSLVDEDPISELDKIQKERKEKLKTLSEKLKVHANLETDLHLIESVPAYKRRNIPLSEITPSNESSTSKYSVPGKTDDNSNPLNENQFLHNKPD